MKKSEREELKRKIDAIRIPHEWWTESISQAIPVVLYRAGDNEWPVLVTQEIPKHITPDDCDKFTFGNEQRARVAEFAGAANPAAIQSMLAYVDRLEAQRDRLLKLAKSGRRAIGDHFAPDYCYATGPLTGNDFIDLVQCPACAFIAEYQEAITEAESQS